MKNRSDKQAEALRITRNKELNSVFELDPGFSCQGEVGKFIGLYIQAEVFAKKLQHYYQNDMNKPGKDELQIQILKAALKHFQIPFLDNDISDLFKGGPGKRSAKTARQLRNGYLHALSQEDKHEILSKASSYIPKLQHFIKNVL